jgi:hypothetical protein
MKSSSVYSNNKKSHFIVTDLTACFQKMERMQNPYDLTVICVIRDYLSSEFQDDIPDKYISKAINIKKHTRF